MKKGKTSWLYFNTETDNDNIGISSNVCFRADDIISMGPTGDTDLTIYFKSLRNRSGNSSAANNGDEVTTDVVTIRLVTANTHFALMEVLCQHMNNTRPTFGGFVDVVDDHTVIVGGAAGSRTLATGLTKPNGVASKISPLILECRTIVLDSANSGGISPAMPDVATFNSAPAAASAGALAVGRHYTNALTATSAFTIPSAAGCAKGSIITVIYIDEIANTAEHTYTTTTDTAFAPGSMVRSSPNPVRIGKVDVAAANDNILTIVGETDGDAGINSTLTFVNMTGATNGWAVDANLTFQGDGSTVSTAVFS